MSRTRFRVNQVVVEPSGNQVVNQVDTNQVVVGSSPVAVT